MNSRIRFLKDHLLDFEVIIGLGIGLLLRYGLHTSWLIAILWGLSVFALLPLSILFAYHLRAKYFFSETIFVEAERLAEQIKAEQMMAPPKSVKSAMAPARSPTASEADEIWDKVCERVLQEAAERHKASKA